MIGASKILTVSYGTFSCTLEGFDDPFNTMRAIAEYFRDLAAEDRYFGAEPPTPDAAMLLKIAEREVQRRVEAKIQDNGVVLRTGDAMEAPAFVANPPPQTPVAEAPVASRAAFAEPLANAPQTPMPEGVAAKLLRIRAAVANAELAVTREEGPTAFAPVQPILTDYTEDQHATDQGGADAFTDTFEDQDFDAVPVDTDIWVQPDTTLEKLVLIEITAEADSDADIAADVETATDAVLDRVAQAAAATDVPSETQMSADIEMSVLADRTAEIAPEAPAEPVSKTGDEDAAETFVETADDTIAETVAETSDDTIAETVRDSDFADFIDAATDPEAPADADFDLATYGAEPADEEMADADYVITAEDLPDLQALDAAAGATALRTPAQPAADDYDEDYDAAFANADRTADDATLDDAFADFKDEAEQAPEPEIDPMLEEIDSAYAPLDEPARGPSAKALRARARVIKVRRDDVPAADIIAIETLVAEAAEAAALLAVDMENKLRRDLRALKADTDTPKPNDVDDEAGTEDDARRPLDAAGEEAVSRLIEQTNEAMAVPENRRRLSAIAHLKAAVAATVADRFSKGRTAPKEAEARLDPYREDLARVVRPQHPAGSEDAPATPRPAPLVLVSAQRIDRPRIAPGHSTTALSSVPNAPIRPRRVSSTQVAVEPAIEIDEEDDDIDTGTAFSDSRGFAEFSERLGANSLSEILEAAAAYSVCIEGRPYFSRPQLMGQIGALSADSEFTREDGLRTFGALLREGRIQKVKRGQFVLTESSHYLAEARKIAG